MCSRLLAALAPVLAKLVSLANLPANFQPEGKLVDELAAEHKRLREKGIHAPFVYVDLDKWVPDWCTDGSDAAGETSSSEDEDSSKALRVIAAVLKTKKEKVCGPASCLCLGGVHSSRRHKAKKNKNMSMLHWQIALNRFAMAAHITGQWTYGAAVAHIEVCQQIAGACASLLSGLLARVCICMRVSQSCPRDPQA